MSEKILDSNYRTHIQHLKSKGQNGRPEDSQYYDNGLSPELPRVEDILLGEIALNVAPGTETIAIKNYNGEIVFIPFNVAKKIQELGRRVDGHTQAINDTNERITVFSSETITRFETVEALVSALSGDTDERIDGLSGAVATLSSETKENIDRIDRNISGLSGDTHDQIEALSGELASHADILSGITGQIQEISENVVAGTDENLRILSATTMSAISANTQAHQVLSGQIATVSGDLRSDLDTISGIVESVSGAAQTASGDIASLSAYTVSELSSSTIARQELAHRVEEGFVDVNGKLDRISGQTSSNTNRIGILEENLEQVSAKTDTNTANLNTVSGICDTLTSLTTTEFAKNEAEHRQIWNALSGMIDDVSDESQSGLGELSGQVGTLIENENDLSARLNDLSAKTDTAIDQNDRDHQEIKSELSGQIASVSDELRTDLNAVSGIADNAFDMAQRASEGINDVSGYVENEIARVESGVTEVDAKVDTVSGNVNNALNQLNNDLGFYDNGTGTGYHPTSENLQDFNVTQSLDYINEKLNEDILSGETRYTDILRIILEDEKVTANFAATINASCGFNIHAKYTPATEILQGLNVTEAIDTVYDTLENDLSNGLENVKTEINQSVDEKLDNLRSGLTEVIISGDTALSDRMNEIERWFNDSDHQPLEVSVTYNELLNLYLMGNLRWGMLYRITNYQATVDMEYVDATTNYPEPDNLHSDVNDGFDILVRATSNWTLSENALAMELPRNDTDPKKFPESWEIKYSLINDVSRFSWALDRGHGVIYYMKDQYGNEAPYDFKNIKVAGHYLFEDAEGNDASNTGAYRNNVINPTYTEDHKLKLNNIHFVAAENAEGNVFKPGCQNISIGGVFRNNTISPIKNGESLINKENTFLGFYYE